MRTRSLFLSAVPLQLFLTLHTPPSTLHSFGVGRRDQAKLGVKDVDQVVEIPGAARITGCFEQFLT
jgi:hypothetical protein